MRRNVWTLLSLAISLFVAVSLCAAPALARQSGEQKWNFNATIIEACSCPMFCPCYFDTKPAKPVGHEGHGDHGGCLFNNAFKVNSGSYGSTKLDGAKFWVSGDLGHDFSMGQMDWAVLTFDPAVNKEQREGITKILGSVYPVKWKSFTVAADQPMVWEANKDRATAKLGDGKVADVVLKRYPGNTDEPIVIKNLKYWGVPRNDGFVLMPNDVQAFRHVPQGQKPYEFKGTNGFMITIDMNSDDSKK